MVVPSLVVPRGDGRRLQGMPASVPFVLVAKSLEYPTDACLQGPYFAVLSLEHREPGNLAIGEPFEDAQPNEAAIRFRQISHKPAGLTSVAVSAIAKAWILAILLVLSLERNEDQTLPAMFAVVTLGIVVETPFNDFLEVVFGFGFRCGRQRI